jgi:hypothetical protein
MRILDKFYIFFAKLVVPNFENVQKKKDEEWEFLDQVATTSHLVKTRFSCLMHEPPTNGQRSMSNRRIYVLLITSRAAESIRHYYCRLRLRHGSFVTKPAKLVAESNTSSELLISFIYFKLLLFVVCAVTQTRGYVRKMENYRSFM